MKISQFPLLALVLFSAIVLPSSLYAGASNKNGNPFGNGTFFQNTGTFSAVIRGQNLTGTLLFSTGVSTNADPGSSGSLVVSYLGSPDGLTAPGVYRGNASGMWDPSAGTISGQFWGGYTLSGLGTNTVLPEIYTTDVFPVPISYVDGATTNTVFVSPVGTNKYNNSVFMNGSFDGYIQNQYPNQTFSAPGTLTIQQLYPQQQGENANPPYSEGTAPVGMTALEIPVSVQGLRISDAYNSFTTITNSIPYSFTTYEIKRFPTGL